MNECTVNIPINEYDRLRLCELKLKKTYINKLIDTAREYAEMSIEIRNNEEYARKVKCQNKLISLLNSEFYEIKKGLT